MLKINVKPKPKNKAMENLEKVDLQSLKLKPTQERLETIYEMVDSADKDLMLDLKENFALELKSILKSIRSRTLPEQVDNPEKVKLIVSNALEFYIELVSVFGTSENFNSFQTKLKLAQ